MHNDLEEMANFLAEEIKSQVFIEVEASGRHVHLTKEAVEILYGVGHQLTPDKPLSQTGQYAAKERLTLVGPKGSLQRVVVLGPPREESQVEISLTDALILGIKAPLRQSGEISDSAEITLSTEQATLKLSQGAIVAKRHIHMTPEDASKFQLKDGEMVGVKVFGQRPTIFQDTLIRVSPRFVTRMHIDYDEANACGFGAGTLGLIIKG